MIFRLAISDTDHMISGRATSHQPLPVDSRLWLPSLPRLLSPCPGPPLRRPVSLIVLHSGDRAPGVAEYLAKPDTRGRSAHFAWSTRYAGLVQMVALDHEAMHAGCGKRDDCRHFGAGRCRGGFEGRRVNGCSWGIELPGPWNTKRDEDQHEKLVALIGELVQLASIEAIVAHSAICKDRHDPGPGLDWARLEKFGVRLVH